MNDHEDDHHDGVGDHLVAGRPDDLAQLGDHLPQEAAEPGEHVRPLDGGGRRPLRGGRALRLRDPGPGGRPPGRRPGRPGDTGRRAQRRVGAGLVAGLAASSVAIVRVRPADVSSDGGAARGMRDRRSTRRAPARRPGRVGRRRASGLVRRGGVDGLLPVLRHPVVIVAHSFTSSRPCCWPRRDRRDRFRSIVLQGRQELNLQPAVLETAALPIELRPFGPGPVDRPISHQNPSRKSGMCPPARHAGKRQHTPGRPV